MLITLIVIDPGPCSVRRNERENSLYSNTTVSIVFSFKNRTSGRLGDVEKRTRRVVLNGRQGVYATCFTRHPPPEILTP